MVHPDEALKIVLEHTPVLESVRLPLADALGAILAEAVVSDIDLPPFDKSAMDGYAARSADLAKLPVDLEIIEEISAGAWPKNSVRAGRCAKIMTGAPVPTGADAVVMVEHTELLSATRVRIKRVGASANICSRAEDLSKGQTVLDVGHRIRPEEVGLLASVGCVDVKVVRRPTIAVLATGDEIVSPEEVPGPGQIRNANSYSIAAQVRRAGFEGHDLGICRDVQEELAEKIREGLKRDVLIVSGGVSMGDYDFVPAVLEELGIEIHFAKVAIKPGKPTVFGTHRGGLIFGLPGNPASSLLTFRLFVLPALMKMAGDAGPANEFLEAVMTGPVREKKGRQAYLPAILSCQNGTWHATVLESHGSADLVALCKANALVVVPSEAERVEAGETVQAMWIGD